MWYALYTEPTRTWFWWYIYPWGKILSSVAWAICSMKHTALQASLAQLIFDWDILLDNEFIADWKSARQKSSKIWTQTIFQENKLRKDHNYQIGDTVLITIKDIHKNLNYSTKAKRHSFWNYQYNVLYSLHRLASIWSNYHRACSSVVKLNV